MFLNDNKDINLLYAYRKGNKKSTTWFKKVLAAVIIEIALIVIASIYLLSSSAYLKADIASLQKNIKSYEGVQKKISEYNQLKTLYNNKKNVLDQIQKNNDMMLNVLATLEKTMPRQMTIESLNVSSKSVAFIVKYNSEESLAQFINNLQGSQYLTNITINGITNEDGSKHTSINAEIVGK